MSALTVSQILSQAADLIEPEGRWIKRELARNSAGNTVPPVARDAICWCAAGALQRVALLSVGWGWDAYTTARERLSDVIDDSVSCWNDEAGRTQAEVVAALRTAAKLSEGGDA